jgi:hypothetical protein
MLIDKKKLTVLTVPGIDPLSENLLSDQREAIDSQFSRG